MITVTRTVTQTIDEKKIFDEVIDFLFNDEIEVEDFDYEILSNLPEDVQRLIFTKIGTMLINYAERSFK